MGKEKVKRERGKGKSYVEKMRDWEEEKAERC